VKGKEFTKFTGKSIQKWKGPSNQEIQFQSLIRAADITVSGIQMPFRA
jgi:hypothetical protein